MTSKPRELEREILKAGYELVPNRKGGHRRYKNKNTGKTIEIPFHSKELKKGTEKAIRKMAGLD